MWLTRNCGAPVQIVKCSRMLRPSRGRSQGLDPLELIDLFRTCSSQFQIVSEYVRNDDSLFFLKTASLDWSGALKRASLAIGISVGGPTERLDSDNDSWWLDCGDRSRQWHWMTSMKQTPPQSLLRNVIFVHGIPLSFDVRFQCEPRGQYRHEIALVFKNLLSLVDPSRWWVLSCWRWGRRGTLSRVFCHFLRLHMGKGACESSRRPKASFFLLL